MNLFSYLIKINYHLYHCLVRLASLFSLANPILVHLILNVTYLFSTFQLSVNIFRFWVEQRILRLNFFFLTYKQIFGQKYWTNPKVSSSNFLDNSTLAHGGTLERLFFEFLNGFSKTGEYYRKYGRDSFFLMLSLDYF